MLQSGNGDTHRNFELLVSNSGTTGFTHISRDSDSTKWSKVVMIPSDSVLGQPVIAGTSFSRNFHAVAVDSNHTLRQWAYSQVSKKWAQVSAINGKVIDGYPGLTQGDGSALILVVKHADGTLNEVRSTFPLPTHPAQVMKFFQDADRFSGNNLPTALSGRW